MTISSRFFVHFFFHAVAVVVFVVKVHELCCWFHFLMGAAVCVSVCMC